VKTRTDLNTAEPSDFKFLNGVTAAGTRMPFPLSVEAASKAFPSVRRHLLAGPL
jgi:hypothetical protein